MLLSAPTFSLFFNHLFGIPVMDPWIVSPLVCWGPRWVPHEMGTAARDIWESGRSNFKNGGPLSTQLRHSCPCSTARVAGTLSDCMRLLCARCIVIWTTTIRVTQYYLFGITPGGLLYKCWNIQIFYLISGPLGFTQKLQWWFYWWITLETIYVDPLSHSIPTVMLY